MRFYKIFIFLLIPVLAQYVSSEVSLKNNGLQEENYNEQDIEEDDR